MKEISTKISDIGELRTVNVHSTIIDAFVKYILPFFA
jgi:hypothetical protein